MAQDEQPAQQIGIQSNSGGDITIGDSILQIAGRDIYNVLPARTPYELTARGRLLDSIEDMWIKEIYKTSLYQEVVLTLDLAEDADAVSSNPWPLEVQELQRSRHPLPAEAGVVQVYDDARGSLLILGEPGSGKTTLLLILVQELLQRARLNVSEGMPVLFPLASWAGQKLALADWLIEQLKKKYYVSHQMSEQWIEGGSIIPLLDGLDEVAQEDRAACVQAINTYREQYNIAPVVLCCRKTDYYTLMHSVEKLKLARAIVIQPLTSQQILHYLNTRSEELEALLQVYQHDPVLQELARTPLMLNILTLTYHNKRREDILLEGSLEEQQRQVFATYIQRMFDRRTANPRYSLAQTISWLSWLAKQLRHFNTTEFDIIYMNTDWLPKDLRSRYIFIQSFIRTLPALVCILLVELLTLLMHSFSFFILLCWLFVLAIYFCINIEVMEKQIRNAQQDQKSKEKRAERRAHMERSLELSAINPGSPASLMLLNDAKEHSSDTHTFIIDWLLRSRGVIPPHYQQFLDYATERIFLQKVGSRYMFIHRLLQDYFADFEDDDDTQRLK